MLPNAIANYNRNNPDNRLIPVNLVRRFISHQQKQKEERKQAEFEVFVRKSLKRETSTKDSDSESENEIEIVREIKRPTKSFNQSFNKRQNKRQFWRPIQISNESPINRQIARSIGPPTKVLRVVNPSTSSSLKSRLATVNGSQFTTLRLNCFRCPQYFPSISHFDIHLQERHNILQHRCWLKDCGKSFENRTQFGHHLKIVHRTVTQWKCSFCSKTYKSHSDLYHHCRSIHLEGEFACSKCGYLEVNRSNAYNHYHKAHQGTV